MAGDDPPRGRTGFAYAQATVPRSVSSCARPSVGPHRHGLAGGRQRHLPVLAGGGGGRDGGFGSGADPPPTPRHPSSVWSGSRPTRRPISPLASIRARPGRRGDQPRRHPDHPLFGPPPAGNQIESFSWVESTTPALIGVYRDNTDCHLLRNGAEQDSMQQGRVRVGIIDMWSPRRRHFLTSSSRATARRFDTDRLRFRRVRKGLALDAHNATTAWRPYYGLEIDPISQSLWCSASRGHTPPPVLTPRRARPAVRRQPDGQLSLDELRRAFLA